MTSTLERGGVVATGAVGAPSTAIPMRDGRIVLIDNARAIGIVLVVIGHAPGLAPLASAFIFAFHMPLFFLLSGLMVGSERLQMPSARRIALLARSLLLPYFLYFLVSFAYWLLLKRHGLRAEEFGSLPWWDPLIGFIRGEADGLYFNVVLWFFPCLFVVGAVHHVVRKILSARDVALLAVAAAATFIAVHAPDAPRWWWSADSAVVGLAFYATGEAFSPLLRHSRHGETSRWRWIVAGIGYAACLAMTIASGHVDLSHLRFGHVPALYLPMGVAGIVATLALSAALPGTPLARWLSRNTLVVFPLHFLMFSIVTGVAIQAIGLPNDFKETTAGVVVLYPAIALLMSWPASIGIGRLVQGYRAFRRLPA